MTSINLIAMNRIPESYRSVVGFYPDVILFQLNQHQFQTKWQQLARAPYIYTNGFSLRPAGWFRYYFESFKGWLGFTNHCNPQLLQLSLRKLAYYGYLHGYQPIHQIVKYPLGSGFLSVVNQERNPANSLQLQTDLINYYSEHSFYFPQFEMMAGVASPSRFGTSFATLGLCDLVPCLDPQDNHIIDEVSKVLEPHSYQKYSFFRGSRYAKTVAQQYLAQALQEKKSILYNITVLNYFMEGAKLRAQRHLERALYYDPDIQLENEEIFIEYFLEKNEFAQAFKLIEKLKNTEKACAYLIKHFTASQHQAMVTPGTPLARELAKHYARDKKNIASIRLASKLDPDLEKNDPLSIFRLLIMDKQFDEAYTLYNTHSKVITFDADLRSIAASHFHAESESQLKIGRSFRERCEWGKASEGYLRALYAARKSCEFESMERRVQYHSSCKRLYAQVLTDADIACNEDISQSDIASIRKAIELLRTCAPKEKPEIEYHLEALVKALMRQADYLCSLIRVSLCYSADYETRQKHHAMHEKHFTLILNTLKEVAHLLKGVSDPTQKLILGKAYFLMGDINLFFDLKENPLSYFHKAVEAVPLNPFYNLRYYEQQEETQREEKYRERGLQGLRALGYQAYDWAEWDPERWNASHRVSRIKEIHLLEETKPSAGWSFGFS